MVKLDCQCEHPGAANEVEVFVEAGILRPADCKPERIGHMISALEERMVEPWCGRYNMEVHLPEPAWYMTEGEAAADDTDYEERPAKRRRIVAAGEEWVVCLELLEGGDLFAWPGCGTPHVFHAACLKRVRCSRTTGHALFAWVGTTPSGKSV
jgi:hypothetical protein